MATTNYPVMQGMTGCLAMTVMTIYMAAITMTGWLVQLVMTDWLGWAGTGDNDIIYGSDVDDYLVGWNGKDFLYGYAGNASLYGTNGDETLFGGAGNDILGGGEGADIYVIDIGGTADNGSDTITDFDVTATIGDIVRTSWQGGGATPSDLEAAGLALDTNTDGDAVLTDSTDTSVIYLTFDGVAQADLVEATHFEIV